MKEILTTQFEKGNAVCMYSRADSENENARCIDGGWLVIAYRLKIPERFLPYGYTISAETKRPTEIPMAVWIIP